MTLKMWQVDAFAERPFEGNPAAIVPLDVWIEDARMQRIANENNLSETAFFVPKAPGHYDLRWFTPTAEVDLCGHATLASALVVLTILNKGLEKVSFHTRSGELTVARGADGYLVMSLPANPIAPYTAGPADLAQQIGTALGAPPPQAIYKGTHLIALWDDPKIIRGLKGPGEIARVLRALDIWGLIVTAPGDEGYDFVSRFFSIKHGIPEDPVTGSAHCALAPFWAKRLGKTVLKARQVSPRGGDLICADEGARVAISGRCALFMTGEIAV